MGGLGFRVWGEFVWGLGELWLRSGFERVLGWRLPFSLPMRVFAVEDASGIGCRIQGCWGSFKGSTRGFGFLGFRGLGFGVKGSGFRD